MDTETFSEVPIGDGTYKYAENAEVMLFAYAVGDEGPIELWDATTGAPMPEDLKEYLHDKNTIQVWHNSMFDRTVVRHALGIDIPTSRIRDTMVLALMHGLPGGLDKLCQIFKLDEDKAKNKEGKKLIQLFCKPRPKNMNLRRATSETNPEEWQDFCEYAKQDIVSMREIYKKLPKWNLPVEQPLWELDQKINDRGFRVDVQLAEGAISAVNNTQKTLAKRTKRITEGEVDSATQRDALLGHILSEYGVTLPDLTKSTLQRRVDDPELPDAVRELISIRLDAATSSTSKYKKLINGVNTDNRLRGTLQFCGASRTGRWAGRTFQPQNLPRPTHKQSDIDFAIEAILAGGLELLSGDVMKLTSSAIRSCIIADEGKTLIVSDLSNIEGRVNAWLAGEEWKLQAFSDFDTGEGHDLYAVAYARSFGITPDEVMDNKKNGDGSMRQIGKVQELALGYGGGVGAFVTMAANSRMDLEDMARKAMPHIPSDIKEAAFAWYKESVKQKRDHGLSQDVFVACDSLKRMWRKANSCIESFWQDLENAVLQAINKPENVFYVRKLKVYRKGAWLRIVMPSGRSLGYPAIGISEEGKIHYMGVDPYTRRWKRIETYGGKLVENVCQAVARDVMAANMQPIEDAGYAILLTVHDELITEAPNTAEFTDGRLSELLATNPVWAPDLPLAAGGFQSIRYKKD